MSTVTSSHPSQASSPLHSAGGQRHVAHHFESPQQQFDAGKLGMWIFLVTEVLFFSGLFVAYAVYRSNHPEVFLYAHQFLDKTLGALNTVVLILSSLTMAWAVRCAQLGQQRGLVRCLLATLACAAFFLGVKAVEYSVKWDEGLLWAGAFASPGEHGPAPLLTGALLFLSAPVGVGLVATAVSWLVMLKLGRATARKASLALLLTCLAYLIGVAGGSLITMRHHHATAAPNGGGSARHDDHAAQTSVSAAPQDAPRGAGIFFSIYYAMTGVHAFHIIAGMGVLTALLWYAHAGRFGSDYFGPIDYFGLYWHLVDLVWIFLFPLLYLIH